MGRSRRRISFGRSKLGRSLALAFAVASGLIALAQQTKPAGVTQSLPIEAQVVDVIDGDTVKLSDGRSLRYIGIDTPEMRRRDGEHWVKEPEPYAQEATEANRRWVEGKRVRLEFDAQSQDRYGRLLAYVYVDDVFVNRQLLAEGFAQPLTVPPNVRHADEFREIARDARANSRGLWALPDAPSGKDLERKRKKRTERAENAVH